MKLSYGLTGLVGKDGKQEEFHVLTTQRTEQLLTVFPLVVLRENVTGTYVGVT